MIQAYKDLMGEKKNIVFIGEAGCGKSESALNFAMQLKREQTKEVHMFDLDQTKPICRSRDVRDMLAQNGIAFHYETHDFDSPTIVGGVAECLRDPGCYTVLDVGGGDIGARIIGRFARFLNEDDTIAFYVVNPYRPWSRDIMAIDCTLSAILQVTRIQKIHVLSNPHLGASTTAEDFLLGLNKTISMLTEYVPVEGACVREELYDAVKEKAGLPVIPLHLFLKYEWVEE